MHNVTRFFKAHTVRLSRAFSAWCSMSCHNGSVHVILRNLEIACQYSNCWVGQFFTQQLELLGTKTFYPAKILLGRYRPACDERERRGAVAGCWKKRVKRMKRRAWGLPSAKEQHSGCDFDLPGPLPHAPARAWVSLMKDKSQKNGAMNNLQGPPFKKNFSRFFSTAGRKGVTSM
jgi:hypothetical protein